jgi:hypothetical protein
MDGLALITHTEAFAGKEEQAAGSEFLAQCFQSIAFGGFD